MCEPVLVVDSIRIGAFNPVLRDSASDEGLTEASYSLRIDNAKVSETSLCDAISITSFFKTARRREKDVKTYAEKKARMFMFKPIAASDSVYGDTHPTTTLAGSFSIAK